MAILEVNGLTKCFGGLLAVDGLSFAISKQQISGIIGPNGAGKTTTLNLITGIFRPSAGRILWKGEDITGLRPHQVANRGIIRTFQLISLFPTFTALENVIAAFHRRRGIGFWGTLFKTPQALRREKQIKEEAEEILASVLLAHKKDDLARNLSYGQQKALTIALALAADAELLLLDEPVTGVSADRVPELLSLIKRTRDKGLTVILVEHNMRATFELCDKIIVLDRGRKICEGTCDEVRSNRDVVTAYLGGT